MNNLNFFTDASTSPSSEIAVGAFLCLDQQQLDLYTECSQAELFNQLSNLINYKIYTSKKSTWSEIRTVIDALTTLPNSSHPDTQIKIYSDCKSLFDLLHHRKATLQNKNFITRAGTIHRNAELYKELFALCESFKIQVIKMKGHQPSAHCLTQPEKIFSIVDKLCRKKLRSLNN